MRTDSERKSVCFRRPNPARKSRGARLEISRKGMRKMKTRIIEDLDNRYLVINDDFDKPGFELNMLMDSAPAAALKLRGRYIDNVYEYEYEIRDGVSLEEHFLAQSVTKKDIYEFLEALNDLMIGLRELLISKERIYLGISEIYIIDGRYNFVVCPGLEEPIHDGLKCVLEFMLEHIDYKDDETVLCAYQVYHKLVRDKSSISSVLEGAKPESVKKEEALTDKPEVLSPASDALEGVTTMAPVNALKEKEKKKKPIFVIMIVIIVLLYVIDIKLCIAGGVIMVILYAVSLKKSGKTDADEPDYDKTTLLSESMLKPYIMYEERGKAYQSTIELTPYVIGSGKERVNLKLKSHLVSRLHARIFCEGDDYFIEDMGSTNGTKVDGRKLKAYEVVMLGSRNEITLANTKLIYIRQV